MKLPICLVRKGTVLKMTMYKFPDKIVVRNFKVTLKSKVAFC